MAFDFFYVCFCILSVIECNDPNQTIEIKQTCWCEKSNEQSVINIISGLQFNETEWMIGSTIVCWLNRWMAL